MDAYDKSRDDALDFPADEWEAREFEDNRYRELAVEDYYGVEDA